MASHKSNSIGVMIVADIVRQPSISETLPGPSRLRCIYIIEIGPVTVLLDPKWRENYHENWCNGTLEHVVICRASHSFLPRLLVA